MRLNKGKVVFMGCLVSAFFNISTVCYSKDVDSSYEYKIADPYKNGEMIPNSPSIPGPTGLVKTPSAYVLDRWDYDVSVDVVGWQDYVKVNVGLPNRFEAGVSFIERAQEEGSVNLKWNFVPEAEEHPAVSVGIIDLGATNGRTKYAVASKNFTSLKTFRSKYRINRMALRYHLGYKDTTADESYFYGLEVRLLFSRSNPLKKVLAKTTFMEEYDGDHFNFGMRYDLAPMTKLHFGILSADDINVGISYRKSL